MSGPRSKLAGATAVTAHGSLRIAAFWQMPTVLGHLGVDPVPVLATGGLEIEDFSDLDRLITYPALGELLLACERATGRDDFGHLLCVGSRLAQMGLAGRIAFGADTAGAGLRGFVNFFNLHDSAATVDLVDSGECIRFVYAVCEPKLADTRHFQMGGVTIAFNIVEDLCGRDWRPAEVTFACRKPANLRPFQTFFRAPLRFDCDESAIVFDKRWLQRPLHTIDPSLRRAVDAEASALRAEALADLPALVRRLMRKQLLVGRCTIEQVAATLSMHRRTLDRRLDRAGTSYGELLESVNHEVARQLLTDTTMTVQRIAEALHFSTAANFSTAFRRWSGITPSAFRARAR
jgi:AraC-like DNA-binding protein